MESLSLYLKRFTRILSLKTAERDIFCEVVGTISPTELSPREVTFREGVVYVSANSSLKNFLFMHKKEILERCKSRGVSITDFR